MLRSELLQLAQAIFNDKKAAYELSKDIEGQLTDRSPERSRLSFYQSAAFLANQSYDYDRALQLLEKGRAIGEQHALTDELANLWLDASAVYTNQRRWREAQAAIERSRRLLRNKKNAPLHAHAHAREGVLALRLKNVREAQEALLEADKALEARKADASLKDHHIHTLVLSALGELYELANEPQLSIEAYTRVFPIIEGWRLWPRLGWHYLNAGRVSLVLNNLADALIYFEKSLQSASEQEHELTANSYTNLGILALMDNNYALAGSFFERGAQLFDQPQSPADFTNLAKIEWWFAELHKVQNDDVGYEDHLLRAYEQGIKGADMYHLRLVSTALADLYAQSDIFKEAFDWQKRASEHAEQFYQELRRNDQQEGVIRQEMERIRQEAQVARLRVSGLQSKALRAQMNPHFLFNALNAIQGFITTERYAESVTYLARFARFMRHTLEYSDLEEVPLDEEINFIDKYLEINKKLRFRDKLEYSVRPPKTTDASDLLIPAMIVQPFVENAIEHGLRPKQAGLLTVEFQLSPDEKTLLCIIEDDGVGLRAGLAKQEAHKSEHLTHRSRGMDITKERLGLLHGNPLGHFVTITDRSELPPYTQSGTRVEVVLPLLEG
jgi:two-component system, LytTR family, sensor kinase